ncbi:hypothetical protein NECAME_10198 [Necator americanus]|uniref:UDENN domain-containing protein n=1 Tax=Necator americanus TaxID=51031 RepID=W2TC97_NECAM|nr:hypothetical protein NECAME_10198 [Necator americanus]ETN78637.1 hypothetical protein NECAME_10198 [Necator americanus]
MVEFSYPRLNGDGEGGLPEEWVNLPSLALPDGAHNSDSDTIFFILPSTERPGEAIFGISCYRQIAAQDLLSKTDDVTRSTVQKSVCVLSTVPLFGALRAKLEVITRAYFAERDFAKVEVLSQMFTNLCEMFDNEVIDEQAASIDISVQELFLCFRHRALVLFKLLLLEKKIVFNIAPAQLLGTTMIALVSLYPSNIYFSYFLGVFCASKKLLEEGLRYCATPNNPLETTKLDARYDDDSYNSSLGTANGNESSDGREITIPSSNAVQNDEQYIAKDSFGFPLSIFTKGSLFHPYLSISYLDMIRSRIVRAYAIGATNALFVTKKDLLDAIITGSFDLHISVVSSLNLLPVKVHFGGRIDDQGCGQIALLDANLKRELSLTSADLRFGDYIMKHVEDNRRSSALFEGSDEWLRLQMREYLLSMAASARSDLAVAVADYGSAFVHSWRSTRNYRIWMTGPHEDLSGVVPGHAFAGQLGVYDVFLRVEHSVGGSEGARRAINAITTTGKNIGETGNKVKQSLSSWLKGSPTNAEEATEDLLDESKVKSLSSWFRGTQRNDEQSSSGQAEL